MRSFVFLLMLAVCLVAWECAATNGEQGDSDHNTAQQKDAGPVDTTKAAEQTQPLKSKEDPHTGHIPEPQPQHKAPALPEAPAQHAEHDDPAQHDDHAEHDDHYDLDNPKGSKPDNADPNNLPTAQSQPGHSSEDPQQLQPQQHASQSSTSHEKVQRQEDTGVDLQNTQDKKPASTPQDETQTEQIVPQEKHTDSHTDHQEPRQPTQPHAAPLSTLSHPTKPGVQHTAERPPTTIINTDNTLGKDTSSAKTRTENNPNDHNNARVLPPSSTNDKPVLPDTNKTTKTTPDKTPVSAERLETMTPAAADDAVHQTSITTGNKKPNQMQTSVTSSSQPVKGEYMSSADNSLKLSSGVKSLDNTDSSIDISSLFVFAALATLLLVAVAPPS